MSAGPGSDVRVFTEDPVLPEMVSFTEWDCVPKASKQNNFSFGQLAIHYACLHKYTKCVVSSKAALHIRNVYSFTLRQLKRLLHWVATRRWSSCWSSRSSDRSTMLTDALRVRHAHVLLCAHRGRGRCRNTEYCLVWPHVHLEKPSLLFVAMETQTRILLIGKVYQLKLR